MSDVSHGLALIRKPVISKQFVADMELCYSQKITILGIEYLTIKPQCQNAMVQFLTSVYPTLIKEFPKFYREVETDGIQPRRGDANFYYHFIN